MSKQLYRSHKSKRSKKKQRIMEEGDDGGDGGGGGGESRSNGLVVRWERLLPRMAFRVLLVEADDSTRQIIAALLRKCSYRVAAVPDGLKAWELLKERPHNIDLILTEENLPSISGYALLTLIMEHEICKNIPVIMMSKEDSISTVYKCMMRGAADYLVKPIRRNELRNLWQHVWRRHSQASRDNLPQDESVGQDRAEGASENNAASNHSTDVVAFVPKNKEDAEKDSDSQSSRTKPDVDAEGQGNVQDFLQPTGDRLSLNDTTEVQRRESCTRSKQSLPVHENKAHGKSIAKGDDLHATTLYKDIRTETERPNTDINLEAGDSNGPNINREGIDFMGVAVLEKSSEDNIKGKFDSYPDLDLSLRSSRSAELETQLTEGRHPLRHSTTSAFTRYVGRQLHTQNSKCAKEKELGADLERNISNVFCNTSGETPTPSAGGVHRTMSLPNSQAKESEVGCSLPQQRIFTIQTPASDPTRNTDSNPGYSSMIPPFLCRQPVESTSQPAAEASHHHVAALTDQNTSNSFFMGAAVHNVDEVRGGAAESSIKASDSNNAALPNEGNVSQSENSSLCDAAVGHHPNTNSTGYGSACGSNSDAEQGTMIKAEAAESNVREVFTHVKTSQREAALAKFRLKRKDRCYDKKVLNYYKICVILIASKQ
ncbi:Two-component response regulator-like APRR5 [Linum grandiflorum]